MKLSKENIKQILLSVIAITLIGIGYFNYSLDLKQEETIEVAREKFK